MTYYLLPRTNKHIYKDLCYETCENKVVISHSLAKYLYEIKEKITDIDRAWDIYKKYTNPYDKTQSVHVLEACLRPLHLGPA